MNTKHFIWLLATQFFAYSLTCIGLLAIEAKSTIWATFTILLMMICFMNVIVIGLQFTNYVHYVSIVILILLISMESVIVYLCASSAIHYITITSGGTFLVTIFGLIIHIVIQLFVMGIKTEIEYTAVRRGSKDNAATINDIFSTSTGPSSVAPVIEVKK